MTRQSHRFLQAAGLGPAVALVFAACTNDAIAPAGGSSLSEAEAVAIGRDMAAEVQDVVGSFTLGDLLSVVLPVPVASTPESLFDPIPVLSCPAISPLPPVDSDGDHVPDELTLSFALPDCRFEFEDGSALEITGTIVISDPSTTAIGHRVVFADFQRKRIVADGSFHLRRLNGVRQVLRTSTSFSLIDSTTVVLEATGEPSGTLTKALAVDFVADAGETLDELRQLPSGDLTVNGSITRTRGDVTRSLTVETVTPLHFDATCTAHQKLTSGELVITVAGFEHSGTIHVVFTGCGEEPIITFEPAAV